MDMKTTTPSKRIPAKGDEAAMTLQAAHVRAGKVYAVLRDGAISRAGQGADGLGIAPGIADTARTLVRLETPRTPHTLADRFSRLLTVTDPALHDDAHHHARLRSRIESTPIPLVCAKARIWMTALGPDRALAQWHVPRTILRNCQTLLGEAPDSMVFVLRGYSGGSPETRGSHFSKLFELELDPRLTHRALRGTAVARLESMELGLRCRGGRYIFLARTQPAAPLRTKPERLFHASVPPMPARLTVRPLPVAPPESDVDSPARDLFAEGYVAALYRRFLREGTGILRRTPSPVRQDSAARTLAYQARCIERAQTGLAEEARQRATTNATASLSWRNLHAAASPRSSASAPVKEARKPLRYPPAALPKPALVAVPLPALDALVTMAQRCPSTIPLFSRTSVEKGEATTQVRLRKGGKLSDAIRSAREVGKSELILRGKVKPGRKVRVGGLRIEPAADGTFCVACVIRNGRLHVPVTSVDVTPV